MGALGDRLDALVVTTVSPDGNITAEVRDRDRVDLWFAGGTFRSYDAPRLAHQLDQLAALMWARYRRECREIVELVRGGPTAPLDGAAGGEVFQRRLDELTLAGVSSEGFVSVRSRGLAHWQFRLHGDAPAGLSERAFNGEVRGAVDAVLDDHRDQVVLLRDEVYGLGLPAWMRNGG